MSRSAISGNNSSASAHERWMRRALELAGRGSGFTSPNPAVGAVVVRAGEIVGEGYHRRAGEAHAEVEALQEAGEAARGATLYVTLEPCNHYGRTPPCSKAILDAGIAEVYYAVPEPNPRAGGGGQQLRAAGLRVHVGPCAAAARHLNRIFFHYISTARPYVIAKFAASLDGKIATHTGDSQWITGPDARQMGHRLRHLCDAITVGVGTVTADDPRLTVRHPEIPDPRHPLRIVLASQGPVPLDAVLFDPTLPGQTVVATTPAMPSEVKERLAERGAETLVLPATAEGRVDVVALLEALGQRAITSLLLEGGGQVLGSFFAAKQVNEVAAFLAPLIIGGEKAPSPVGGQGVALLDDAFQLERIEIERLGRDIMVRGLVPSPSRLEEDEHQEAQRVPISEVA